MLFDGLTPGAGPAALGAVILLAALAVQFMFDGLSRSGLFVPA